MKQNIFLFIIGMSIAPSLLLAAPERDAQIDSELREDSQERHKNCEGIDEFEDFFCSDCIDNEKPRTEKIKPSRVQLAMIRLGVAIALRVESVYDTLRTWYRYVRSWMRYEQDKA